MRKTLKQDQSSMYKTMGNSKTGGDDEDNYRISPELASLQAENQRMLTFIKMVKSRVRMTMKMTGAQLYRFSERYGGGKPIDDHDEEFIGMLAQELVD